MLTGNRALNADTATDDDHIQRRGLVHTGVRGYLQTVAGPYLAAIGADLAPAARLGRLFTVGVRPEVIAPG